MLYEGFLGNSITFSCGKGWGCHFPTLLPVLLDEEDETLSKIVMLSLFPILSRVSSIRLFLVYQRFFPFSLLRCFLLYSTSLWTLSNFTNPANDCNTANTNKQT